MPRFRFQWANIPTPIRTELAVHLPVASAAPEAFAAVYGVRPKTEFIQQAWPHLIDCWLFHDDGASQRIAEALRARRIGDPSIEHDMQYLRSCRNAGGLREVVLSAFIAYGEQAPDRLPEVPSHPQTVPAESPKRPPAASGPDADPLVQLMTLVRDVLAASEAGSTLAVSNDGDIRITYGSSYVFVRLHVTEEKNVSLRVYSVVLSTIPATAELYETLNHINVSLPSGRIFAINDLVVLESTIVLEVFTPEYLIHTVAAVGFLSDVLDDRLKAAFGGTLQITLPAADAIDV